MKKSNSLKGMSLQKLAKTLNILQNAVNNPVFNSTTIEFQYRETSRDHKVDKDITLFDMPIISVTEGYLDSESSEPLEELIENAMDEALDLMQAFLSAAWAIKFFLDQKGIKIPEWKTRAFNLLITKLSKPATGTNTSPKKGKPPAKHCTTSG